MNSNSSMAGKIKALQIVRIGLCSALLFISQIALSFIPNCELVSFLTIIFTLAFGPEMFLTVTIFSILEGMLYGFGLWVVSYLYVWPVLVLLTLLLKPLFKEDHIMWTVLSTGFGLIFGAFFAIAYIPVNPSYALTYWISGLPWDVWHAIANGIIMFVLYKPVSKAMKKITNLFFQNPHTRP